MQILALITRLLIAAIFFVAASTKFFDRRGAQKGIRDFGLPEWAASVLSILLPVAELGAAILLLPQSTVLWGSLSAAALLFVFIGAITVNLARGRKPECNCFGQLHSEPIGWKILVRNCVLLGGAGIVFWESERGASISAVDWVASLSKAETIFLIFGAAMALAIGIQAWFTLHLFRQNGRLLLRIDGLESEPKGEKPPSPAAPPVGLPIGDLAPAFELPSVSNLSDVSLDKLLAARRPVALIFSDPDCGPCSDLLPIIAKWQQEHANTLTISLIMRGSAKVNLAKLGEHRIKNLLLQKDHEIATLYRANGTPAAVLVGIDGKIKSFVSMGAQAIEILITTAVGKPPAMALSTNGAAFSGLAIGSPAPALKLPDLKGKLIELSDFKRKDTVLIFWNPKCGFCAKMLGDLKQVEQEASTDTPQILVVSTGPVEENVAMRLRSTVVLDQNFATASAFYARGTPSAVLVDSDCKIASGVAVGAPGVLALARTPNRISAKSAIA